jgi:membrane protease YdiL (CAAX protease family)
MIRLTAKKVAVAWERVPVLVRAVAVGWIILQAGSLLSVLPLFANLSFHPEIPWSLPLTCAVVAGFWAYCAGRGPPNALRAFRQRCSRAGPVPARTWLAALPVLVFGPLFLVTLRLIAPYLMPVAPPSVSARLSSLPPVAAAGALFAVALGSAVVEELAFRGYMQKPLEERYGLATALLVTGLMFWVAHFEKVTVTHLPGHLIASVVFGLLARFTRSIAPAVVAHAVADLVLLPLYFLRWPPFVWTSLSARPFWEAAPDSRIFAGLAAVLCATGTVTVLALRRLSRCRATFGRV